MDGSFLALPSSGTGTYLRGLIGALPAVDQALDLRLITPRWDDAETPSTRHRALLVRLQRDRRLRRATWELLGVARAARAERPDLLHIPHFSAPVRAGYPLVVTIHDVI